MGESNDFETHFLRDVVEASGIVDWDEFTDSEVVVESTPGFDLESWESEAQPISELEDRPQDMEQGSYIGPLSLQGDSVGERKPKLLKATPKVKPAAQNVHPFGQHLIFGVRHCPEGE